MIKAIFFDLDDTLLWDEKSVKKAFESTCSYAASKYDFQPEQLEEAVRSEARDLYASYDTHEFTKVIGINPFEGLWGDFGDKGEQFNKMKQIVPAYRKDAWTGGLKKLGIDDPKFGSELAERFPAERKKAPFLFEDALPVLEKLKQNYSLLMLTNGSPELQNIKLTITPELSPFFDEIIISGDHDRGKPDEAIFHYALEKMSVKKEEVLMVGDNLMTDILGANRTGIKSIWLNRFGKSKNDVIPYKEIQNLHELFDLLNELD
ncbi:haloacid dehalogenase [Salipaludibacillus keqinensis]|uniref:Phosphoserine phosphatase n=1 Tax=Salipaludibacillus keqinensis TaxID=2045207 RepID=A0A323TWC0_9BACI|nr:HAD family hydrolase [Salipaludibacillus keqinensis]PYZ93845.1 haloacid dehalogenase [Salipaludibacillus keqinensis]